jgi:hypothetical protein
MISVLVFPLVGLRVAGTERELAPVEPAVFDEY